MFPPRRLPPYAWIVALIVALGFLGWLNLRRSERLGQLGALGNPAPALDARSPTGYAGGMRHLLAPGHNNESYQWIAQTQQMIATGDWRLRHVDYDNAPNGRAVTSPSVYRWWLAAVAWADRQWSGRSAGLAVEHAALVADPTLLALLVLGGTVLAAWRFGPATAVMFPLVAVSLFPFGGSFLPGGPDSPGLSLGLMLAGTLLLLAGTLPPTGAEGKSRRWLAGAGIVSALGLWVNARTAVPLLLGQGLGGLLAGWFTRKSLPDAPAWRTWSYAGAATTLVAWLVEYAPAHLDLNAWRLSEIHPLYALGWLGGAELLARSHGWLRGGRLAEGRAGIAAVGLAALGLAAVPAVMWLKDQPGFLMENTYAFRLTALGEGASAANLAKWMVREGTPAQLLALAFSLALPLLAVGALLRRDTTPARRGAIWLAAGPAVVAAAFACYQPSWCNQLGAMLLALLVAATAGQPADPATPGRWRVAGILGVLVSGAWALIPIRPAATAPDRFTKQELISVVERDFAHWLANRVGENGATVLAPPDLTSSLIFHGGLRGIGSAYRENDEGFRGSVRLASAIHADEAQALARQRNLTHIIIPSWEGFLDEYARLGGTNPEQNLMGMINRWLAPRWLRPMPYYLPALPGFEDDRLVMYEMVEVQGHADGLSRLTEYFLDMGQFDLAGIASQTLASDYGADLSAQIARARTAIARRERPEFNQALDGITAALKDAADDALAWDRRVSLSLVLAQGGRTADAKRQASRCLEEMSELDLRSLSETTLFHFLGLCKALDLPVADARLKSLATSLLPPALRSQL